MYSVYIDNNLPAIASPPPPAKQARRTGEEGGIVDMMSLSA